MKTTLKRIIRIAASFTLNACLAFALVSCGPGNGNSLDGSENNAKNGSKNSSAASAVAAPSTELAKSKSPVVSVELVSQEKPLVFYELMEQPQIEGIKVKLTREDGSSEVVDAYDLEKYYNDPDSDLEYWEGMFFVTGIGSVNGIVRPKQQLLEPGIHRVAMYCVANSYQFDEPSNWNLRRNPEETEEDVDLPYCMVEVYAQTLEEYLEKSKPPTATATDAKEGSLKLKKGESGIVQLSVRESGTYMLHIDGNYSLNVDVVTGSGVMFEGESHRNGNNYYFDYYAQLAANKPMYVRIDLAHDKSSASLKITLTRIPETAIGVGETATITERTALRIKDYDSGKTRNQLNKAFYSKGYMDMTASGKYIGGYYIFAGKGYEHYSAYGTYGLQEHVWLFVNRSFNALKYEGLHAALDGIVIIPQDGKAATVTLRLADITIPQKTIRLKTGETVRLDEKITTDYRGDVAHEIAPTGVFELQAKDDIIYLHALKKGEATLTLGAAGVALGEIAVIVE